MFFVLGALMPGVTIAVLGLLMDISPDDQRPAYSGYFNALTAPAYLLPLAGGVLIVTVGASAMFSLAAAGAAIQLVLARSIPPNCQTTPDK